MISNDKFKNDQEYLMKTIIKEIGVNYLNFLDGLKFENIGDKKNYNHVVENK